MNKKILISLIILAVIAGGFFYWWFIWELPQEEGEETSQPPTLFAKEDYKIEEREDGKYIVVEKVGLTCKVPEGWEIKIEGNDIPEPEYWVNLSSPDAEVKDILIKGCGIGITAGSAKETAQEIKERIKLLQENSQKSETIRKGHTSEIIEVSGYLGIKGVTENSIIGKAIAIDIPVGEENLIRLDTLFPLGFQEKCSPIWEEFLKNVVIE